MQKGDTMPMNEVRNNRPKTPKRITFFTGAGMSKESGLPTFRGEEGLWSKINIDEVASRRAWYCGRHNNCNERRQRLLDFINPIRQQIINGEPNDGHRIIAAMAEEYDVVVITQNIDDLHERAGSTNVIHLHGEILKNASTLNPHFVVDIDIDNPTIRLGDKAPDGSQLRPHVLLFGEDIDERLWRKALEATKGADIFVVVGTTMLVHPAADLLQHVAHGCEIYVIDPMEVKLPDGCNHEFTHITHGASEGLRELLTILKP